MKTIEYGVICHDRDEQEQTVFVVLAPSPLDALRRFLTCQEEHWDTEDGGDTPQEGCPCCGHPHGNVPHPDWEPIVAMPLSVIQALGEPENMGIAFQDEL